VLINLGCALRVFGQTATDFTPNAFPVAGVSGLLEVTGLAMWGTHLWLIMSGRPRLKPAVNEEEAPPLTHDVPIGPKHTVGAVLEHHPELVRVFVDAGFPMLANPQMRKSIARLVTIERACDRTGVDQVALLDALNQHRSAVQVRCCKDGACGHAGRVELTELIGGTAS
jgi:hypothetical protein